MNPRPSAVDETRQALEVMIQSLEDMIDGQIHRSEQSVENRHLIERLGERLTAIESVQKEREPLVTEFKMVQADFRRLEAAMIKGRDRTLSVIAIVIAMCSPLVAAIIQAVFSRLFP